MTTSTTTIWYLRDRIYLGAPGHELRLHTPAARRSGDSTSGVVRQTTTWGGQNPRRFIIERDTASQILPRDNYTTQSTQTKKNQIKVSRFSK